MFVYALSLDGKWKGGVGSEAKAKPESEPESILVYIEDM